ncbi:MAG: class II aldolase/adducin family protein [Pseudomonadota bacterium]
MTVLYEKIRQTVAETALELLTTGLVVNTSGNVSARLGEHVVITPSGKLYTDLTPEDVSVVDLQGNVVDGDLLPSSETPLHLGVYEKNPGVSAIVHTHSLYATAVSTLVSQLPAIHYQIADLGGPVPVVPYRTFGTSDLASVVSDALKDRTAVLMQNHGSVTVGDSLRSALARSATLEWLSKVYLIASRNGSPSLLDGEQLQAVAAQFSDFKDRRAKGAVANKPRSSD